MLKRKTILYLILAVVLGSVAGAATVFLLTAEDLSEGIQMLKEDGEELSSLTLLQEEKEEEGEGDGQTAPTDGPYLHSIYFASSSNGTSWTLDSQPLAEHASVPEIIELSQDLGDYEAGTLLSYFVDAENMTSGPGGEEIGILSSSDSGQTWSARKNAVFPGLDKDMTPVDPSVIQLDDSRLRLYFFDITGSMTGSGDSGGKPASSVFYSAVSSDGVNFDFEGQVFSASGATDPDVVYFNDKWLMYYAGREGARVATSADGLTFSDIGSLNTPGVPNAMVVGTRVYVYNCYQGVSYATSTNGTSFGSFTRVAGFADPNGKNYYCDSAPTPLADGGYVMMIKAMPLAGSPGRGGQGGVTPQSGDRR